MAIAFDVAGGPANANAASLTYSHTCASNATLIVIVQLAQAGDNVTNVTYAGVTMSQVKKVNNFGDFSYAYVLSNPASGTNSVVVSVSPNSNMSSMSVSYTGCNLVTQPDVSNTNTGTSTSLSASVTTTQVNDMLVAYGVSGGTLTVTGGANSRVVDNLVFNGVISDLSATSATSYSMTYTQASSIAWQEIILALQPPSSGGTVLPFKLLLGVGK